MTYQLRDIAYGRSGDKGSDSNIGIAAYTQEGFNFLKRYLTEDKLHDYFANLKPTKTIRYEMPNLKAFNFLLKDALGGGASESLRIDSQGKALAQILLNMPITISEEMYSQMRKPWS